MGLKGGSVVTASSAVSAPRLARTVTVCSVAAGLTDPTKLSADWFGRAWMAGGNSRLAELLVRCNVSPPDGAGESNCNRQESMSPACTAPGVHANEPSAAGVSGAATDLTLFEVTRLVTVIKIWEDTPAKLAFRSN